MEFIKKALLHNRFDIEVRDSNTGKLKQRAYAENIILNQAWAVILSDTDWFDKIYFGTGSGMISATRTALFTPLSSEVAADASFGSDIDANYYYLRQSISILENEHVGSVLTEVGVGTATVLCTHAMIKDMNGNPVSMTKTDTDILVIYATIYLKISNISSDTSAVDFARHSMNPLTRTLLGRRLAGYAGAKTNGLSYILTANMSDTVYMGGGYKSGDPAAAASYVAATIDVANKKISYYHRIAAANGNISGLRSYCLGACYTWEINTRRFEPCIVGRINSSTATQSPVIEQIGTGDGSTLNFSTTFPFVKSGATIKVDGSIVSETVITGKPNKKNITGFLRVRTSKETPDYPLFGREGYDTNAIVAPEIFENPYYTEFGLTSLTGKRFVLESSTDKVTWTAAVTTSASGTAAVYSIPSLHQKKRYYRLSVLPGQTRGEVSLVESADLDGYKNVRLASPPATGSVITAEYECDCAAKDVNHVLDVTVVIQLGEYTP